MKNKKRKAVLAVALSTMAAVAMIVLSGCGTDKDSGKETDGQTVDTQTPAESVPVPAETEEQVQIPEEQPEITPDTSGVETDEVPADTEAPVDHPAASGGEGDTNGFYDDAGTWITVYKNSAGQWVDESGMIYEFGDDGVTDQNGVFYPY